MSKPPKRPEHRTDEDTEVGKVEDLGEENLTRPTKPAKKENNSPKRG
jgi:hypothetical protein